MDVMWGKVDGKKHTGVARLSIANMICKHSGVYTLEMRIPSDKRLSKDLVGWMNKLHLTFEQRQAFRLSLLDQGIFVLVDLAIVDVKAVMQALAIAAGWTEPWAKVKEGAILGEKLRMLKFMEIAKLKLSGHEVTIVVTNKGGPIKSWLLPVSKNCNRVSPHLLQVTHHAITELMSRGFLPTDFESKWPLASDRLEQVKASWTRNGVVVMPSTLGEMFCKAGGTYNLNVVLDNDDHLEGDLVSWMNGLALTYLQRTNMRKGFFAQHITDLTSLRRVDVAALMVFVLQGDHVEGFDVQLEQRLLDQKQFLIRATVHSATPGTISMLRMDEKMLKAQQALDETRFEVQRSADDQKFGVLVPVLCVVVTLGWAMWRK